VHRRPIIALVTSPLAPQTLLVVAVTTTIKTRSLLLSRRVEARPSRSCEARVFARNFGRAVGRITASPYHDDALADALAEARVDVWARLGLALKHWGAAAE
jgi:hypothetical protein